VTRWIGWLAIIAGASFMVPVVMGWSGPGIIVWKGLGVGLLALWAAMQARSFDGWLITAVMAFGALGDVLLDAVGLEKGAVAFVVGHLIAVWLYARNRRPALSGSQQALSLLVLPLSLVIVWAMLRTEPGWWHAALYTGFVAVMAAMAWRSAFPRYRTGLGAMLFLLSDLLIFARLAGIGGNAGGLLIWPLYFGGQALIVWGVVSTLRGRENQAGIA
jgi:uncharacterized membrane protein YhhN